jgi:hypothetical protein
MKTKMTIPAGKIPHQREDIVVKEQYPEIKVDKLFYYNPLREGKYKDVPQEVIILVSTMWHKKLFYEWFVVEGNLTHHEENEEIAIVGYLKQKIHENINKYGI